MNLAELAIAAVAVYLIFRLLGPLRRHIEQKILKLQKKNLKADKTARVIDITSYQTKNQSSDEKVPPQ